MFSKFKSGLSCLTVAALAALCTVAHAAPTPYFVKNDFVLQLATQTSDSFGIDARLDAGSTAFPVLGGAASLRPRVNPDPTYVPDLRGFVDNFPGQGRSDATGNGGAWWETNNSFRIDFTTVVQAFGFTLIDAGDFRGALELIFETATGALDPIAAFTPPSSPVNGTQSFFGIIDPNAGYTSVTFRITPAARCVTPPGAPMVCVFPPIDFLGFDDLTIGTLADNPPGGVPEPTSLALVGAALLLLARTRRSA